MNGKAALKVPGGKLLKVSVEYDGELIRKVKFSGDFFMHPEEAIETLEGSLAGVARSDVRRTVERELDGSKLYGVDVKSLVKVVWEALG